jgi:uncharacterized membrane protein
MFKQPSIRTTKVLASLLVVLFVVSVTAAAVNAKTAVKEKNMGMENMGMNDRKNMDMNSGTEKSMPMDSKTDD